MSITSDLIRGHTETIIMAHLYKREGGIKVENISGGGEAKTSSAGIHTNFTTEKNKNGDKATAKIGDDPTVDIIAQTGSGGIRIVN